MASQRQPNEIARGLWESLQRLAPLPSQPRSNKELKDLAIRGQAANAVLLAFARDLAMPLNAPGLMPI
jgi:hypothetical protein